MNPQIDKAILALASAIGTPGTNVALGLHDIARALNRMATVMEAVLEDTQRMEAEHAR